MFTLVCLVCHKIYVLGRPHQNDNNRFRQILRRYLYVALKVTKFGYLCVCKNSNFDGDNGRDY